MVNDNQKKVQFVLFVILIFNFLVAGMKMLAGSIISSSAMVADGFHSLSDGSSNIIGIIGIQLATKPEDEEHPYGHDKIEIISALVVGFMLVFVGLKAIYDSITKYIAGVRPSISKESIIVMIITLVINIIVVILEKKQGKKLGSAFLITDANHTKSDIFVTIGVFISLILLKFGAPPILDVIVTFFVGFVIFKTAYEVLTENGNILIDAKSVDDKDILNVLEQFDGITDVHKIRSRGTKNRIFVDMHIHVNPDMTVREAHTLNHAIINAMKNKFGSCTETNVHIEPKL